MSSVLERYVAESRSRSFGMIHSAKAAAQESAGAGQLMAAAGVMGGGVGPLTRQTSIYHAAEQYRHFIGTPYSAIRVIAQRVAGQALRVARKAPKSKKKSAHRVLKHLLPDHLKQYSEELDCLEEHPFLDVMHNPNAVFTKWMLMFVTVASMQLTGQAYLWCYDEEGPAEPGRNGKKKKGTHKECWPWPVSWIQPKHKEGELYAYYECRVEGALEPIQVPSDQMIYLHFPDPANPLGWISPLQAQARYVVSDEAIAESQRRSFSNGIYPGLAIIAGRHPDLSGVQGQRPILTREQREQMLMAIRQRYRGVQHTDDPVILDGVIEDIKPISLRPRDMDFLNSMQITERRIERGFGVNPIVQGAVENANRASATVADELFVNNCVNPLICLLSEALTKWARPMFDDDDSLLIYIEPAVTRDPDMKRAELQMMYDRGAVSVNEMRQEIGLPPIHMGDVAYIPQGLVPVHVVREDQPEPDEPAGFQFEEEQQQPGSQQQPQQQSSAKPRQGEQNTANGKPGPQAKPSGGVDGDQPEAGAERQQRATLERLAKAFLKLRGLDRMAQAGTPPAITVPVEIHNHLPAAVATTKRVVSTELGRDQYTHLITRVTKTEEESC